MSITTQTPPGLGPDGAKNPNAAKHQGRYLNTSFRASFQERAKGLSGHAERIAAQVLGEPDQKDGATLRWGNRGSLALSIRGDTAGLFFDHEAGEGGDLLDLIQRVHGGSPIEALLWAEDIAGTGIDRDTIPVMTKRARKADTNAGRTRRRALELWEASEPLAGSLAADYLARRRLHVDEHVVVNFLRYHPACPIRGQRLPCMVSLMADPVTGEQCGIQRTPLTPDARKHDLGRAMLGKAGVVMVTADADVTTGLNIVEGVEDALALAHIGMLPVWAAMSAGAIARFPILAGIDALTVLADGDEAGRNAARACARRWRETGRQTLVLIAPDGSDAAEALT